MNKGFKSNTAAPSHRSPVKETALQLRRVSSRAKLFIAELTYTKACRTNSIGARVALVLLLHTLNLCLSRLSNVVS